MTTNAIAYCRRSKESGARTVSLADQAERVRAYIAAQGWHVAEVLVDDGVSGGKRERFDRIRAAVTTHRARAVVVYHLDRFGRDVAGMLDELRGFHRRGVELHVVGRGRIETESASGFLATTLEAAMAEHYRRLIGEKTRDALGHLREQGRRYTRVLPYGWQLGDDGASLVEDVREQAVLGMIRGLRESGASLAAIAGQLAEHGIMARSGRPFAPKVVRDLASRPAAVTDRPIGNA
jgi:DNA invertase Pin-like site-specific DNA recombinase